MKEFCVFSLLLLFPVSLMGQLNVDATSVGGTLKFQIKDFSSLHTMVDYSKMISCNAENFETSTMIANAATPCRMNDSIIYNEYRRLITTKFLFGYDFSNFHADTSTLVGFGFCDHTKFKYEELELKIDKRQLKGDSLMFEFYFLQAITPDKKLDLLFYFSKNEVLRLKKSSKYLFKIADNYIFKQENEHGILKVVIKVPHNKYFQKYNWIHIANGKDNAAGKIGFILTHEVGSKNFLNVNK